LGQSHIFTFLKGARDFPPRARGWVLWRIFEKISKIVVGGASTLVESRSGFRYEVAMGYEKR
jgi:hypothetical protein